MSETIFEHRFALKIYLEDTDAQGIVYYANYLKFLERARSEMIACWNLPLRDVAHPDRRLVVHEMHIKYHRPAQLGDLIEVLSNSKRASDYRLTFQQSIHRQGEEQPLVTAEVQVVCVDRLGAVTELPKEII